MEKLITLTVEDISLELHVVRFSGSEALNCPFRFEIDLISPCVTLDVKALISRCAYLSFGSAAHGIHGLINSARVVYTGQTLSHCRVILEPRLQLLQNRRHRRLIQHLSVPLIIQKLLAEHAIGPDHYRFDLTAGSYPPRVICAQYDEDDLHLVQRLCAEEGIHYRFEHSSHQHVLVFADDPGAFRELPLPIFFRGESGHSGHTPVISYLAEHFAIGATTLNPLIVSQCIGDAKPADDERNPLAQPANSFAANQPRGLPFRAGMPDVAQTRQRQLSERNLERTRCERRDVQGRSNHPDLVSGQIMSVLSHPNAEFNDHWLLTEVYHKAQQLRLPSGFDPVDIERVIGQLPLCASDEKVEGVPINSSYQNHFKVVFWTTPYRPPLTRQRPQIQSPQTATLIGPEGTKALHNSQGQLQVRLHWPTQGPSDDDAVIWLPVAAALEENQTTSPLLAGDEVLLNHFDNDPNQPMLYGLSTISAQLLQPRILIDGKPVSSDAAHIHLSAGQTLDVESASPVTLASHNAHLELQPDSIAMTHVKSPLGIFCQETDAHYGPAQHGVKPENFMSSIDFSALLQPLAAPKENKQ